MRSKLNVRMIKNVSDQNQPIVFNHIGIFEGG